MWPPPSLTHPLTHSLSRFSHRHSRKFTQYTIVVSLPSLSTCPFISNFTYLHPIRCVHSHTPPDSLERTQSAPFILWSSLISPSGYESATTTTVATSNIPVTTAVKATTTKDPTPANVTLAQNKDGECLSRYLKHNLHAKCWK